MKLSDFRKRMPKPVFTWEEARRVAWETQPTVLRLELYNWRQRGELLLLKRGVYAFADRPTSRVEIAQALTSPAYISLEWALHEHGLIPDVPFAMTLVTPRGTRRFQTPQGEFLYHHIKPEAFWGYDPHTLLATPEKAIVDYLYMYSGRLAAVGNAWEEMRWQNIESIDFRLVRKYADRFRVAKVLKLAESLEHYAKT